MKKTIKGFRRPYLTIEDMQKLAELPGCYNCMWCLPVGEGDHICEAFEDDPALVLENYLPTEDFLCCDGTSWEGK